MCRERRRAQRGEVADRVVSKTQHARIRRGDRGRAADRVKGHALGTAQGVGDRLDIAGGVVAQRDGPRLRTDPLGDLRHPPAGVVLVAQRR